MELTSATSCTDVSSRTTARASSKLPSTGTTVAPWATAWASFPLAIFPAGRTTMHATPARAAYAAAAADVLPVEAQAIARAPDSRALDTAMVMPRSLNEPVGFAPSYLRYTSRSTSSERRCAGMSGVSPSKRVMIGVASDTGSRSRYCSITPGQLMRRPRPRAARLRPTARSRGPGGRLRPAAGSSPWPRASR